MRKLLLITILTILATGCIHNDIPFPVVAGEVKAIEFIGEKEVKIEPSTRTIYLTLGDSADLRAVKLSKLEITPDSRTTLKVNEVIDFSMGSGKYEVSKKPFTFTISTYQEYEWKVVCSQPLDLKFNVQGGIGEAIIDQLNKSVIVKVPQDQDLYGIVVEDCCLAPAVAQYSPDPYSLTNFSGKVTIDVEFFGVKENWNIFVQKSIENVVTGTVNPWALFADVTGSITAGSSLDAGFEYKRKNAQTWSYIKAKVNGGKITATITGLTANNEYVFRAKLGEETADEKTFRTESTPVIPNMSFEEWSLSGKTWYPNALPVDDESGFWATGNPGVTASIAGGKDSNTSPTNDAHSGNRAAQIKTIEVPVVGLAAGSLFTGRFVLTIAAPLTSPKFSRPYAGRPTGFKFWYKYDPKKIETVRNNAPAKVGDPDRCNIYIYLGDWDGELLSSELKKGETRGVIAFGEFSTDQKVDQYIEQTINLTYYDTSRAVKKIIVVGSSSIYGDFYTGGIGSTLLLDDLQFVWTAPVEK